MKLSELLEEFFRRNLELRMNGEHLHYPEGMSPELKAKLRQYETTIISYLRDPDGNSQPIYPLSSVQKMVWFLDFLAPGHNANRMKFEARCLSKLDIPALNRSLQALVNRHASLRTTYLSLDGEPVQQIQAQQEAGFEVIDSIQWDRDTLQRYLQAIEAKPFDLKQGPLLQAYLFTLPKGKHLFWLFIHQIAADHWSFETLIEELGILYAECRNGRNERDALSALPPIEQTYIEYIRWKLNMLASPEGEAHLAFFRTLLAGTLPVLNLPTDRPRPPIQTYNTASRFVTISSELTQQIKMTVQAERTSLYPFLAAAFFVLLFRYTGQEDIVIGAPHSEQGHRQFKGVIGYFDNPLPLRANLSGNPTFRRFFRTVHQMIWEVFDHEDYPSHLLMNQLHVQRDASHAPLFQTIFSLQEHTQRKEISPFFFGQGGERIEMDGLVMQSVGLSDHLTIFVDLQLNIFEEHGALTTLWQYNSDLFDEATIERMGEHFQVLLRGIIAAPDTPIAALPLLTDEETHKILHEWNNTTVEYPQDKCIHQLVEEQAERTPDAIAVVFSDAQLTYTQLNQRANQLARYLQKHGVGPDVLVGICVERSLEMIIGMLGILKAGGAYVPLDPTYPKERLAYMIEDAQVTLLLTQSHLLPDLPIQKMTSICLDKDWQQIAQEEAATPGSNVQTTYLAYVIYTSGSTGKPKGVQVFHRGITNLALAQIRIFDVQPSSRILQFASLNFDASLSEIVITLCAGATLCLGSRADILPGTALVQFIEQEAITHVTLPPSALAALPFKNLSTLRTIIVAGETCPLELALKWSEGRRFINAYGPTESTVCATAAEYKGSKSKLSIGRPIGNTQVYILDRYLHPVPIGVSGELYIGGIGLAKGYLNRKELTAERFIPNPFSNVPQSRLYKTGDLAKYLLDGNIEFLGRFDSQVKIRGYRIELEEIENSLISYPAISEAVVTVRDDINQNKRLIAYLIPRVNDRKENYETLKDNIQPQQISQWQSLFDGLLSKGSSQQNSTFNIAGWNSSYTGKPLPEEEMRQWVEHTIERILALQPKRVLEIGCGTGLLLFRIAPRCQQYWGIDFSDTVLNFVQQQLQRPGMEMPQVQLFRKTAEDFEGIPPHSFNVVILNSVSQHFPDVIYFQKVLAGMIQSSAIGGSIFIGDVRSLPLLELFHSSIQRYQAPEKLSMKQLRQRIQSQIKRENELVIAPEFFLALKQQFPRITSVRILAKRGSFSNELTCFRYDVVLHLDQQCLETPDIYWIDWHKQKMSLPILRQILLEDHPECLGLHRINNARLQQEIEALKTLRHAEDIQTVAKLREAVQDFPDENAINPEAFWQIGEELSYQIEISWAAADPEGAYDVVYFRQFSDQRYAPMRCQIHYPEEPAHFESLAVYANHPSQGELERKLIPRLRAYLQEKLPEYMIPAAFVLLEKLPLTPSGKIDRNALPAPERSRPELDTAYVAPRSELEEQLVEIWKELLDLEQIGVHDDFFELGGDSLTATRLISHVRDVFELELSVTTMFDVHHIAGLAELIETTLAEEIEAMSEEDVHRLLEEDV